MDFITGEVIYINKPLNWTSFDLIRKLRYKLCRNLDIKKLKVGHAGTLDPLASGVMIVCTGKKTKLIENFQAQTKEYIAKIKLGVTTPSFDLETQVDATYPTEHITEAIVLETLKNFIGEIHQIPPVYSACKVNGKRAYELARNGQEVELKSKILVIDHIELLDYDMPTITIKVTCSKGTYIRALARDIGQALNSGGHLIELQRTRVGDISLEQCIEIDEFDKLLSTNEN